MGLCRLAQPHPAASYRASIVRGNLAGANHYGERDVTMPVRKVPVLVVDDDDDTREVLRRLLEGEGYRVLLARDGQAGLDALRASRRPLVVLLDWWMPHLNGLQLLEEAAHLARGRGRRHRYVLISATYDPQRIARGGLADVLSVSMLRKPFDIEDVLAEVERQAASMTRGAKDLGNYDSADSGGDSGNAASDDDAPPRRPPHRVRSAS